MSIERKNGCKPNSSQTRGTLERLVLSLSILRADVDRVRSSRPITIAPDCPQPTPIPATLSESDSPAAQNFSKKVQAYLLKVQTWLKE